MRFTSESSDDQVVERSFTLDQVPGLLWSPASGSEPRPVILMGHGGGLSTAAPSVVSRARHHVVALGFHVVAIDAPGHGDRPRSEADRDWVTALRSARAAGQPIAPIVVDFNASLAERAVPEWRAVMDELQRLPEIGDEAPMGYSGMTLATMIGLPLAAVDSRIRAAVFGGAILSRALLAAAAMVTVPTRILLPWDDDELERQSGIGLYDAIGAVDKSLHVFPGNHREVPWSETEDSAGFFARHLAGAQYPSNRRS